MSAIELDGVSKRYGAVDALRSIDLTVERGEVFGFLGPNGAGKSTTIDLLLDYLSPTSGSVTVLGHDAQREPVSVRRETGILPEAYAPLKRTTGREHVEFAIAARNADDDPATILERVELVDDADRLATDYSKGMTQRLALGLAYLGISVAISALLRTTDWTAFTMFSVFLVFVLVWRFVTSGAMLVLNGFEFPETVPAWVSLADGLSPSVAYEYLINTYVVEDVVSSGPGNYENPLISVGVLLWWIVLLPALAYWRFSSTDL